MKGFFPAPRKVLFVLTFLCFSEMLCSSGLAQVSLQNVQTDPLIEGTVQKFYVFGKEKNLGSWKFLWHENSPTLIRREKSFENLQTWQTEESLTVKVLSVINGRDKQIAEAEILINGVQKRHLGLIKEGPEWKIWHEAATENFQLARGLLNRQVIDETLAQTSAVEVMSSLNWLGYSFYENRNYQSAIDILQPARELAQKKEEKEILASTLILIGHNYLESARLEAALESYTVGRELSQKAGFEVGILRALSGIGNVCNKLGRYFEARDALETRLKLLRKNAVSRNRLLITLKNLGNVYYRMGDFEKALRLYEESATLGPPDAGLLLNIGFILTEQKRFPEAEKKFRDSLAISRQNGQKEEAFRALNGLGMISLEQENYPDALNFFKQGVEENAANKIEKSQIFLNQGFANYKLKKFDSAIKLTEEALNLAQETGFAESLWFGNYLKGRVLRDQNKLPDALQSHFQAIQIIDRLLAQSPDFDNLESLFDKIEPYKEATDLLVIQDRNEEALSYSERAKAKILLRSLRRNSPDIPETKSFSLSEAGEILSDHETALIEYVVTEKSTIIFLITKSAGKASSPQLFVRRVNYGRRQLEETVAEFNRRVATVNYDLSQPQNELYDVLFRPIEKKLIGKNKLIIVPDGVLWNLPFQALKADSDQYLLDRFALTYARSLNSLLINRNRKRSLLQRTNPNLLAVSGSAVTAMENKSGEIPYAEESVTELSSLYGSAQSTVFTGDNATKDRIKAVISNYNVIHFAVHGVLNERNPMLSYLQLTSRDEADNGKLEAHEIQNLKLEADLVILAGCETGRGKIVEGEGVIGLTWAVEKAGASVVIVSQWKVRDKSTRDLMLEFHRLWREKIRTNKTLSAGEALRSAALAIQKKYPHPVYWAGFVAIGDAFRV